MVYLFTTSSGSHRVILQYLQNFLNCYKIELLQVLEYFYMIVKHTVSKLMYTKNMYQHKMTQECILPQTSDFSQIRVGKEGQEQEQVVRRRSTARVRTDRQTVY